MIPENRYVLRRFALKTGILSVFALAQWRQGVAITLAILFGISGMLNAAIALYRRSPMRGRCLNYWDEAAAFTLLSGFATLIARLT